MSEPLIAVKEAAAWLGVSTTTMYQLARTEQVRSVRVGRLLRFRQAWLAAYAEQNATGPEVGDVERLRGWDGFPATGRPVGGDVGAPARGRKAAARHKGRGHRGRGVEADAGGAAGGGTVELAVAAQDRKRGPVPRLVAD